MGGKPAEDIEMDDDDDDDDDGMEVDRVGRGEAKICEALLKNVESNSVTK
jgi:hypothetical protein